MSSTVLEIAREVKAIAGRDNSLVPPYARHLAIALLELTQAAQAHVAIRSSESRRNLQEVLDRIECAPQS